MEFRLRIACLFVPFMLAMDSSVAASNFLSSTNETDWQALLAIKDQIQSDPFSFLASWNHSIHFCSWPGIACNITNQRVIALNLSGLELGGFLSPYIGNLTFLKELKLEINSFHGTIPVEISLLYQLQYISLHTNSFQGEIPRNLSHCSEVKVINLEKNILRGSIPAEFGKLSNLELLGLSSNGLSGSIPPSLGNLSALRTLSLSNNILVGSIPAEFGKLSNLELLGLSSNGLSGSIPPSLGNLSALRALSLLNNMLEGSIPAEFGKLSNLEYLGLSSNRLSGSIPPSLGNLSALRTLSLLNNMLEGSIPAEFGKLSNLEYLGLSSNRLSGALPELLLNSSSIQDILVASNFLNGSFPWDLGLHLPRLRSFYVAENQFSGPIPASITNASELEILDIGTNDLSGPIPMNMGNLKQLKRLVLSGNPLGNGSTESTGLNFLTSLANCANLSFLHLNANDLTGELPGSIANLSTALISLRLDENFISGGIPEGLDNLINLQNLALSQNMLTGIIPEFVGNLTKLQGLLLSRNSFSGVIPSSIGDITFLSILEMQENMLEGGIPVSLSNCKRLLSLNLSHNRLTGAIPEEVVGLSSLALGLSLAYNLLSGPLPVQVGSMINLVRLDVSHNQLSGEIPSTLGSCISLESLSLDNNHFSGSIPRLLGGLKNLEFLDLSFNVLEGEVPNEGLFTNSTAFSIIGNKKLCGGLKSMKLPECQKQTSPRKKEVSLCFVLVTELSGFLIFSLLAYISITHYPTRQTGTRRKMAFSDFPPGDHYPKLSYKDLIQATDGFSPANLICMGRYSSVYRGILKNEQKIAVKVLNLQHEGTRKSFVVECEVLRNIRHRNLVKIITSFSGTDLEGNEFKALIYELMPNGSLESWLHPSPPSSQKPKNLDLIQRLNIAIDIASALYYLHHCCEIQVIHRDIKPSNILLDGDLCAHLGDFGSARSLLLPIDRFTHIRMRSSAMGIIGTVGYVALECGMGGRVSTLVDVYSYGILLLEMFTGQSPTDNMFRDNFCLHNYVKMASPDQVMRIADPRLLSEGKIELSRRAGQTRRYNSHKVEKCLTFIFHIGVKCSAPLPGERMKIADALMGLKAIRDVFLRVDETSITPTIRGTYDPLNLSIYKEV